MSDDEKPATTAPCEYCGEGLAVCVGTAEGNGEWALACDECCGHGNEDGYCVPLSDVADLVQKRTKAWEEESERAHELEQQLAHVTRERDEARAKIARYVAALDEGNAAGRYVAYATHEEWAAHERRLDAARAACDTALAALRAQAPRG